LDRIRVLIADDHTLVRDGTRRILETEEDLEVVAEASNGEEAVALTSSLRPDVAIIDIAMPVLDGIEVTRQIKALYPATAILILTAHDNDQFIYNLLEAGAAGYLLKSVRSQELVDAVRALHAGAIARKVLNYFASPSGRDKKHGRSETLTQRELDILKMVTKGLSNKEIANELSLSARTVQRHLESIFIKLQVGSRTEAQGRVDNPQ